MPGNLHHARESIRQELGPEALPAVAFVSTIEDAVREADLVIDCVPDELESKLEILWLLDRMAPPRTVIATPTTNLSIADLASCTNRPEKCIAIAASPLGLAAESMWCCAPGRPRAKKLWRWCAISGGSLASVLKLSSGFAESLPHPCLASLRQGWDLPQD